MTPPVDPPVDPPTDPTDPEARIRRALEAHAAAVEPRPGGLARIEEKLMADPTTPEDPRSGFDRSRLALALGAAAAVVLVIIGFVVLAGDDDDDPVDVADGATTTTTEEAGTTTTEEEATTTTEEEATTTTEETAPPPATPVDPATVLFPDPYSSQRFEDPLAAGRAFATEVAGMQEPFGAEFRQGDARSGEVVVRPMGDGGPETIVLVRQMEDDAWFVIGAVTDEVRLDEPAPGDQVSSPVSLSGAARAFEGTVQVRILADGHGEIGSGFVTGGGDAVMPFEGEIDVDVPPGAEHGLVVLYTEGGEDMVPWTFTATRIRL